MTYHILLTFDVEDWFQVENLRPCCPVSSWSSYELRVVRNTHRLLDLLDSIEMKNTDQENIRQDQHDEQELSSAFPEEKQKGNISYLDKTPSQFRPSGVETPPGRNLETEKRSSISYKSCLNGRSPKATFYVLGWIAERVPNLVREIAGRGHEVASHGCGHELCSEISPEELRKDLVDSKRLLEDLIGERVYGYRAPSFSISEDILKRIADAGYLYDSSYNSFGMHGRYGKISLNGAARSGIAYKIYPGFYELPISNLAVRKPFSSKPFDRAPRSRLPAHRQCSGLSAHCSEQNRDSFVLPWGGGAYFRLIPAPLFRMGVREILRQQQTYLFYMHPWEVDPEQPRAERARAFSRFKHYTNLSGTEDKLRNFLQKSPSCSFVTCHQYLERRGRSSGGPE